LAWLDTATHWYRRHMQLPAMDFGIRSTVAEKITNYGTAVTVGVFIGTALTTGIAAGVAGWYFANTSTITTATSAITNLLSTAMSTATTATTTAATTKLQEQSQDIAELTQRVVQLEHNFRLLNQTSVHLDSNTEVEL